MMNGIQQPMVVFTTVSSGTTTTVMPTYNAEIRMPYQITPKGIYNYLMEMGFIHTTSNGGDIWMRNGTGEFYTWEQAVAYCLIKPFLNP